MKCLKIIVITFVLAAIAFVVAEIYFFKEVNSPQNINRQLEKSIYYYQKGNYLKSLKYLQGYILPMAPKIFLVLTKLLFWIL